MRRRSLIALAAALALLAAGLLGSQWLLLPTTLRVAVGPANSEDTHLIAAVAQSLAREREGVRLRLVVTDGERSSAEAMAQGKVDLAVVRTDVSPPTNAQAVVILHQDAVVLMTLERTGLRRASELAGRRIGVVRKLAANTRLLENILSHYDVAATDVIIVPLGTAAEVEEAFRTDRIDAVLAIGTPTDRALLDTVAAVTQASGGAPVFVPIGEAEAIVERSPVVEAMELVQGAFGGNPPRPAEPVKTVSVSHLLVARSSLDDGTVAEFTRLLFSLRPALSKEIPLANRIEEPDTSKDSSWPVHAGAAAYYDGEVLTFMERWGDWVYLIIMVGSIAGSAVAGAAGLQRSQARSGANRLLDELFTIVSRCRTASSEAELADLEVETDTVLAQALARASDDGLDQNVMLALFLGLDQARRAITERRKSLAETPVSIEGPARPALLPHAAE